jgi:hypothetical protein
MANKYFKAIDRNEWIRNPQWLQFPVDDGLDDKAYLLIAIFEDDADTETLTMDLTRITQVDWGDGTVDTGLFITSLTTATHTYDYSTLGGTVLVYEDGRNYKQVMVELTCDNATGRAFFQFNSIGGRAYGMLDCDIRFDGTNTGENDPNSYSCRFGVTDAPYYLERVKAKYPLNGVGFTRGLRNAIRLSKLEVPSDWLDYTTQGSLNWFEGAGVFSKVPLVLPDINNSVMTAEFQSFGRNSFRAIMGDVTINNVTDTNAIWLHSHLIKMGNVTMLNSTIGQNMFGGTIGSNSLAGGIGEINMPALVNARWMFRGCKASEIVMTDCGNIFNRDGMFFNTGNISKLIMNNLRRGVDISNNKMSADALDAFFNSLGTNLGSDPITITGNPGAATCDTTIATSKGFTVIT